MTRSRGAVALRRAMAVVLTLPLTGVALVVAAPGASAAVTSPGNGTEFTSYSTITISASYGRSSSENRLTLTSPGGPAVTIRTAPGNLNGGSFEPYRLDTACWTSESCSGTRLAPNGTWTVTQTGGDSGSITFVTRIAPRAPSSLTATVLSSREVRLSWPRGAEPDLTGFQVLEGSSVVKDGIGLGACEGSSCSTVVSYATDGSGDHTYAVRSFRSTAPGSGSGSDDGGTDGGSTGDPDTGSGGEPSDGGSPDAGGGSGGDGPASPGGSTGGEGTASPGSTTAPIGSKPASGKSADELAVAQRKAFALGFSAFGPKLGIPKLPPLPQAQAPAIAPELPDGTYEPTLGFEDQVVTERVEVAQGPTARVRNVVGSAIDSERLATSTAAALVLLLAGAHLRRWLSAAHDEH